MPTITVVMQKKINLPDFPNNKHVFLFGSTKRLTNTFGQDSVYIHFFWLDEGKGRWRMRHYYTAFVGSIPNATQE